MTKLMTEKMKLLHPSQVLVLGFTTLILVGAMLLTLPISSATHHTVGVIDALFTSTSAVCVTGLVVLDTGTQFSLFGQLVILLLIQCGGLGIMAMASMIFLLIGKQITLRERILIKESLNEFKISSVVRLVKTILQFTFVIELLGAALLCIRYIPQYGVASGIYHAVFHSVSAFCNAGFDINGGFQSFTAYVGDPLVNFTLMTLIILGGLGFVVIFDLINKLKKPRTVRLTLHSKLVLYTTAALILIGIVGFFAMENANPNTLGGLNPKEKVLADIFQSVTPRTAGFNTIDQGKLTTGSKMLTMALMFVGASPGGTGGGIKTTTAIIVFLLIASVIQGKHEITVMKRQISRETVLRAITLFVGGLLLILAFTFILVIIEDGKGGLFITENIMFEVISAFGTVGLSTGITPFLAPLSRVVIILAMFTGRVGLLTVMYAVANRLRRSDVDIHYTEENVMIG